MPLLTVLALACAPHLGRPQVTVTPHGEATLPLVHTRADPRRWYVVLQSEELGERLLYFDTGFGRTTCDDELAEELGLRLRGRVRVRGEAGGLWARTAELPPFSLGPHQVHGLRCVVRDLDTTSSIKDTPEVAVAGVLGADVLRDLYVVVEPDQGRVRLLDPNAMPPLNLCAPDVVRLRRELAGLTPRVRVPVDVEGEHAWLLLDTGASGTSVPGRRLGLAPVNVREGVTVRGTGRGGTAVRDLVFYELESLRLAAAELGPTTVIERLGRRLPPVLGLDQLSQLRAEYDLRDGRARFSQTGAPQVPTWTRWDRSRQQPPSP